MIDISTFDFSTLNAGDTDPTLNKVIKTVMYGTECCIVYIDVNNDIQWADKIERMEDDKFGLIVNKMSYWESICNKVFKDGTGYENKTLLAEGAARAYANINKADKTTEANEILDITIDKIKVEAENILRNVYVISALISFVIVSILFVLEQLLKRQIISNFSYDWHTVLQTAMIGGVGAFVSAITRAKDFKPEIVVDAKIHALDGVLRIVLGVITGVFIWLGIKSNLAFGFLNSVPKSQYVILFMGLVSGISERIMPTIVKQFESKADSEK